MRRILAILLLTLPLITPVWAATDGQPTTVKKERNHIRAGNKLFNAKRYAEAEVEYRKALQVAPQSAIAQFNLATTLLKQGGGAAGQDDKNNPINQAAEILTNLTKNAPTKSLRAKANYDLGNIAYTGQQYAQAVEFYKQALREDPSDDQARYNLRLAQLKLKEQQQNQDKNKNQNQNKDKDQQDKDQNKDKDNKDQNEDNKDKQNQDKQNQQQQQPQQGGMSQQNAEQVLKTMQNQENATQQRVNAVKAQQERRERQRTNRKW